MGIDESHARASAKHDATARVYAASGLYHKAKSHRARARFHAAFGAGELLGKDLEWFKNLFGVEEGNGQTKNTKWNANRDLFVYDERRGTLATRRAPLTSWQCGTFAAPSLAELSATSERQRELDTGRRTTVRYTFGDVSVAHDDEAYNGSVFQAASQFNCLEFPDEKNTPADGVAYCRRKVLLLRENVDKLGEVRSQSFWCALRASLALRRSSPSSAAS